MKTCIYARKSTNKLGQKETIDNQISICKYKAKEYKLDIVDIKTDQGTGTDDISRPEVKRLIADAIEQKYQCVIMKGISRFYRDTEKGLALIKLLDRHKIRVITIEENFDSLDQRTGTGKIDLSRITMYLMFAEMESKKTADRVKFQQMEKARKGLWNNAANPPFGYNYNSETKKLEINLANAEVIKLIYNSYEDGMGVRRIAQFLNGVNDGEIIYPSSNGKWSIDTIAYVLNNRSYVGDVVYNMRSKTENIYKKNQKIKPTNRDSWVGNSTNKVDDWIIVEDAHEPIINRDQFIRVQKLLEIKSNNKGIRRDFALFAGLLKCDYCGKGMTLKKRKWNKETPQKEFYYCVQYAKYGKQFCRNHRIAADELEDIILTDLLSFHKNKEALEKLIRSNIINNSKNNANQKKERTKIEQAIRLVSEKMDKLLVKNIDGDISDQQFKTMNTKYSDELDMLTNSLEKYDIDETEEKTQEDYIHEWAKELEELTDYLNMDKEKKRSKLIKFIDKITIKETDNGKAGLEVQYRFNI